MLKKILYTTLGLFAVTGTMAQAALFDRGNGMIYDDVLDITWLQDANYAKTSGYDADGNMNKSDAIAWVEQLTYGGYDDWRLPDTIDGEPREPLPGYTRDGELSHLFYEDLGLSPGDSIFDSTEPELDLFINLREWLYWEAGPYISSSGENHETLGWAFQTYDGMTNMVQNYRLLKPWAVRSGDVSPVPVPAAVWLFGAGLIGLIGVSRRKKI